MRPELTRVEPIFSPRPWGVRSLAPFFPEKTNLPEPLGEAWLTSVDSRVATGPYVGMTLGAAWREMPVAWRGTRLASCAAFPILVKFIFPNDKLSIQVHPGDAYAEAHEQAAGGRGKTEMWHVLSAEAGAQLLLGFKPGIDKDEFLSALASGTLENLIEPHAVHAGDTFFVAPGTPHTIGPGMILCEVQEYSDLTYRVYDYGRVDARGKPRELHIAKALAVMNFGSSAGGKIAALPLSSHGVKKSLLAACKYFATERWEFMKPVEFATNTEFFNVLVILSGNGKLESTGEHTDYHRGETWFLPAAAGVSTLLPNEPTTLLRVFVPDLAKLKNHLREQGFREEALSKVLFE